MSAWTASASSSTFRQRSDACWNDRSVPALEACWHLRAPGSSSTKADRTFAIKFFQEQVDPLLTPVTIDPSHPFPRVLNKALCLALLLRQCSAATRSSPLRLPRHPQQQPLHAGGRVALRAREASAPSCTTAAKATPSAWRSRDSADEEIVERLRTNFELDPWQVFRTDGPVNLSRLMNLYSEVPRPTSSSPSSRRRKSSSTQIHRPLRRAAQGRHPAAPPLRLLQRHVEDFIERRRRPARALDEADPLPHQQRLAHLPAPHRRRADQGSHRRRRAHGPLRRGLQHPLGARDRRRRRRVFHGILGLKTHCKLALLVRRDPDGVIRRYAHLGTGNYNPVTARFYTDISLLTARPEITAPSSNVFRYLTAEAESDDYKPLLVAPLTLAETFIASSHRETEHARPAARAHHRQDERAARRATVEALYAASQAGVEIDLIVRGMCALRPGVKGLSENIRVRSIVGRFLEHSRIFYFANGGRRRGLLRQRRLDARNLFERCEVVFPVKDPHLRARLRDEILAAEQWRLSPRQRST
jgi:polyphosphate kinase